MAPDEENRQWITKIHRHWSKKNPLESEIMRPEQILSEVRNERLFGCVEVDIGVPDHLKEKFGEMCPIFKNTDISRYDEKSNTTLWQGHVAVLLVV